MEGKGFLWLSTTIDGEVEYEASDAYIDGERVLYAVYSDTRNIVGTISEEIYNNISNVTEVYFMNDTIENINSRYDSATVKDDLTLDNQGSVNGWIEESYHDDNFAVQCYALYIASEGTTYLTDCSYMFYDCYSTNNIYFDNVDTSMVTDMSWMFGTSTYEMNFYTLDVTSFNTSAVINMKGMLGAEYNDGTSCVWKLYLNNLDTSNVTDMSYMFSNCSSLINLDLSDFDTSNVRICQVCFMDVII